ncbi:hypothetical protein [Lacticigenium naphthae]|uniref:hypothetical protein n=1 Tax=Lacticigenium naphthae TaxID=515351 RepID=UPI000420AAD4|nr:hypothetical protein [Lacticigenium naphthae]
MRWTPTLELIKVNLIYSNPQIVQKKRKKEGKGEKTTEIYKSVLLQNVILFAVFLFLFGSLFLFSGLNFTQYPGLTSTNLFLFVLLTFLQGMNSVYNLFYQSKDLINYLPLPFRQSEWFVAKFSVLMLTLLPFLIPILGIFLIVGIQANRLFIGVVLQALIFFIFILSLLFLLLVVLIHYLSQLPLFKRNKELFQTIFYTISSIGMFGAIFIISNRNTAASLPGELLPDSKSVPFFVNFHTLLVDPFDKQALLELSLGLILLLFLVVLLFKVIIPTFFNDQLNEQTTAVKRSAYKSGVQEVKSRSLEKTLLKYNFGLVQNATLITQQISSTVIFPIIFLAPQIINGLSFEGLPLYYWKSFFWAGFVFALFTVNALSIVSVIISLDRENFTYMKSLPFSMKSYLRFKFWFAYGLELILPLLLSIVIFFFTHTPLLFAGLFISGLLLGMYCISLVYFVRDYRLLELDWQTITELFNRGSGAFGRVISMFVVMIVGGASTAGITVLSSLTGTWGTMLAIGVLALPILIGGGLTLYYKKKFWSKFEIS